MLFMLILYSSADSEGMSKYYRIKDAAAILGVGPSALRSYTNQGLVECTFNPAGQRIYTMEQLQAFMGTLNDPVSVFYVRSSDGDSVKMGNQAALLESQYGTPVRVYKDRSSGLSDSRPGLSALLRDAERKKFNRVCVTQKDRLTRFGFKYLSELFRLHGVEVVVLGEDDKVDLNEELMKDFMSLIASFSGKFYRLRGYKQQAMLLKKAESEINEKQAD